MDNPIEKKPCNIVTKLCLKGLSDYQASAYHMAFLIVENS